MLYAIISDVHSNLEAFSAVLRKIDSLKVDTVFLLGDIVGYNANPNECINIVRQKGIVSIVGNHDQRVCGLKEPNDFNSIAKDAVVWTREILTEENLEFLKSLPDTMLLPDKSAIAIHGSLTDNADSYILSPWIALKNFNKMEEDPSLPPLCFFGHTHIRLLYHYTRQKVLTIHEDEVFLDPTEMYLINPGSVGQPRDRNTKASFLTFDTEKHLINFFRVPYDIKSTCNKILKAGLPRELAERLTLGW